MLYRKQHKSLQKKFVDCSGAFAFATDNRQQLECIDKLSTDLAAKLKQNFNCELYYWKTMLSFWRMKELREKRKLQQHFNIVV